MAKSTLTDSLVDNARLRWKDTMFFKVFCVLAVVSTASEPILIAFNSEGANLDAQMTVLAFSTVLFAVGLCATYAYMDTHKGKHPISAVEKIEDLFDSEVKFEFIALCIGWLFINSLPGIAALRCFRVIRLLWYFELFHPEPDNVDPALKWFSLISASSLCLLYVERILQELFSAASKGGVVVMLMFFYVTYVISLLCWIELSDVESSDEYPCSTLSKCYIVVMRLAFYDGTGFDFLAALIDAGKSGYAALLLGYMCLASIILLNGLIGIFGSAFSAEDKDDSDDKDAKVEKQEPTAESSDGWTKYGTH
jgi:hypothetical protein